MKIHPVTGLPLIALDDWWNMVSFIHTLEERIKALEDGQQ